MLSVFSFQVDNLSKCQWIFTKVGMCIDIVDIWFVIANEQIFSIFERNACNMSVFCGDLVWDF